MKIETKFNVGDEVYIINERIEQVKVRSISIDLNDWSNGTAKINYSFKLDDNTFTGEYVYRDEDEIFKTPEEALTFLKNNINRN